MALWFAAILRCALRLSPRFAGDDGLRGLELIVVSILSLDEKIRFIISFYFFCPAFLLSIKKAIFFFLIKK